MCSFMLCHISQDKLPQHLPLKRKKQNITKTLRGSLVSLTFERCIAKLTIYPDQKKTNKPFFKFTPSDWDWRHSFPTCLAHFLGFWDVISYRWRQLWAPGFLAPTSWMLGLQMWVPHLPTALFLSLLSCSCFFPLPFFIFLPWYT